MQSQWPHNPQPQAPPRRRPPATPATRTIVALILGGFALEVLTGAWSNPARLVALGAIYPEAVFGHGEWWRLLSAIFLHGDGTISGTFLHLIVNLISLTQLGRLYEQMFGTRRFVLIYIVAGLSGSLASLYHLPWFGSSVGASGAIFGILGAFIFSIRRSPRFRRERWAKNLVAQCVFWGVANLILGFQVANIDNAGHIGGLVAGLLLGAILPHRVPPPSPGSSVIDVVQSGADPAARTDDR
ncbi:MAG TPA: rhomboid family intramembrane serine protease [Thermoanaerobaculia bacterium]